MDPVKILKRAWFILWSYRALWVFGLVLALGTAGTVNNGIQYQQGRNDPPPSSQTLQEAFREAGRELERLLRFGVPESGISGQAFTAFLWTIGAFFLLLLVIGIVLAVARYVSETAVIRMVDEYEASGRKMTVRQGIRLGWSNTAWRLFLIDLIVSLPVILLVLILLGLGISAYFMTTSGNGNSTAVSIISLIGFAFLTIFVAVIVSIFLRLLRNFFWRIAALEDASVTESLQRGFALVRENWKNVGLMWLVMIGLGIVWAIGFIFLAILTIPVVIVTAALALILVAVPFLLLVIAFSLFLGGPLPWAAAGLFILPLFFVLAFSPWILLGSWQAIYVSTVWTLTYREIKSLPAPVPEPMVQPAGD